MSTIMNRLTSRLKFLSVCVREKNVWTSENIVKSPYKDIVVPNMTVDEYVFRHLERWADKTAVVCAITARSYTYEQVYKKSRVFGANLRRKLKVKEGDVIGVVLPNVPEYPIITFGILAAGGVVTPINPIYTAYEIQRLIQLSDTTLIITNEEIAPTVKEAIKLAKKNIPVICLNITKSLPEGTVSYKELVEDDHADLSVLNQVNRSYDDVAFLPYSSGTTGMPKGVQLTHRNVAYNCEQQNTELRQYAYTTASHQDNMLVVLPLFHSYGLGIQMLHKMSAGLKLVTLPKFQPDTLLDALLMHKIHLLYLAPPMVMFLGSYPKVTAKHLEQVTSVTSGAAPLPTADINRLLDKVGREIQLAQGYGLTEASPLVSITPFGLKNYEAAGYCLPNMEMRIVDIQNSNHTNLGPDQVGELLVRGPNVMKGYLKNPKANEEAFDGEWLRTGDLGKIDQTGLLTIADRLKELIKVKGFQVPPAELESVLKEHPSIADAAVVGFPDDVTGEKPRAFVVLKQGARATDKDIIDYVATKVAPYKKVKQVTFLDTIPKNASGKIMRKIIKEQYS